MGDDDYVGIGWMIGAVQSHGLGGSSMLNRIYQSANVVKMKYKKSNRPTLGNGDGGWISEENEEGSYLLGWGRC